MSTRICRSCHKDLSPTDFHKSNHYIDGLNTRCKNCSNVYNQHWRSLNIKGYKASIRRSNEKYYWKDPEKLRAAGRNYSRKIRLLAIEHYGGKCACCGEWKFEFLAIDHVNGGGQKDRKSDKNKGSNMAMWLYRHDWPDGFRILCHNCNQSLGHYGYCPHQVRK